MKNVITTAAGSSLNSATIPGGRLIASVTIDNPSGSWLTIVNSKNIVPAFTIGYVENLEYLAASITITVGPGPYGQASSGAGDPWQVTLDTERGIPSAGYPYVSQSNQSKASNAGSAIMSPAVLVNGGTATYTTSVLGGSTSKRIRIYYVEMYGMSLSSILRVQSFVAGSVQINATAGNQFTGPGQPGLWIASMVISPNRPTDRIVLNPPIDLTTGREITYTATLVRPNASDSEDVQFQSIIQVI